MTSTAQSKSEKYLRQIKLFIKNKEDEKVKRMLEKINKLDLKPHEAVPYTETLRPLTKKPEHGIGKMALDLVSRWTNLAKNVVSQAKVPSKSIVEDGPKALNKRKDLKRKSEETKISPKPAKQAKSSIKNGTTTTNTAPQPLKEITGLSFLDAINSKPATTPPKTVFTNVLKSSPNASANAKGDTEPTEILNLEFDYPEGILEDMEKFCSMAEDWALSQNPQAFKDDFNVRKHSMTPLYAGKTTTSSQRELSLTEKVRHHLRNCVDSVEYIGNIPFEILKPVLKHLTPSQLERFENFNPSIVRDTEELWKNHVSSKFSGQVDDNPTSWREFWMEKRKESKAAILKSAQKVGSRTTEVGPVTIKLTDEKRKGEKPGRRRAFGFPPYKKKSLLEKLKDACRR